MLITPREMTVRHRFPDDRAADPRAEVRPLVDGVVVLRQVHPEGPAPSRRHWTSLHRRLLWRSVCHCAPRGRPGDPGRRGEHQWPRREEPDVPGELTTPEGVDVEFRHAQAPGERARSSVYASLIADDQPIGAQVQQLAARMLADDPRKTAELRDR